VDHGSPDLDTTLMMIREAFERGTRAIVCTPHLYELDLRLVGRAREVHGEVVAALRERGIPIRLLLGFEVDLAVAAGSDLDALLMLCVAAEGGAPAVSTGSSGPGGADGRAGESGDHSPRPPGGGQAGAAGPAGPGTDGSEGSPPGGGGRAIVLEMPYSGWPVFLEQTVFRLSSAGLLPILAHPERNDRVQRSPDALAPCLNAGAIAQGTAGSLTTLFRKQSAKTFYELLARGWFSLMASDAHSEPAYTWSLEPLLAEIGKRLSPSDRELLTEVNPALVLEGRRPVPVMPARRSEGGLRRFL
jgi:tyrosine-protein phosphatase YwqE